MYMILIQFVISTWICWSIPAGNWVTRAEKAGKKRGNREIADVLTSDPPTLMGVPSVRSSCLLYLCNRTWKAASMTHISSCFLAVGPPNSPASVALSAMTASLLIVLPSSLMGTWKYSASSIMANPIMSQDTRSFREQHCCQSILRYPILVHYWSLRYSFQSLPAPAVPYSLSTFTTQNHDGINWKSDYPSQTLQHMQAVCLRELHRTDQDA